MPKNQKNTHRKKIMQKYKINKQITQKTNWLKKIHQKIS